MIFEALLFSPAVSFLSLVLAWAKKGELGVNTSSVNTEQVNNGVLFCAELFSPSARLHWCATTKALFFHHVHSALLVLLFPTTAPK